MKRIIIIALALVMLGSSAVAQSASGKMHGKGHHKMKTTTTTDKKVKRDMNRGGHMNNGDNGDMNNNRGKGDKNNR
jgi:Ni/Co efflux regulator RcnB